MADFLCPHYNVPLTVKHVPERPEGSFCTVLSGQVNNSVNGTNNNDNNNDDDETNLYASYNRTDRTNIGKKVYSKGVSILFFIIKVDY